MPKNSDIDTADVLLLRASSCRRSFGSFTIDCTIVNEGIVTLYDRNLEGVSSVTTNAVGQYRVLYEGPDLYFINAVKGLATTGFQDLQLKGGEKNLDLNVLVTLKTVTIKGQVTTQKGFPIGFAALKFSSDDGKFSSKSVFSDKFGFYDLKLTMPSFAVNLQLDVRLGGGLAKLSKNGVALTALASRQSYQVEIDKDQLELDYQVKMPAFAKQIITVVDIEEQPVKDVTTIIFEDNNDRLVSLGKFQSDAKGQVNFYYPTITNIDDDSEINSLSIRTQPAHSYTSDYEVLWLNDEPDDGLNITYDKRRNSATGNGTTILGYVEVIEDDDSTYRTEAKVSVMDVNFNLVETLASNPNGFYSISLDLVGDYYIRAQGNRGKSPWRKVKAWQDEVDHTVIIDPRRHIVDISGTLKTLSGKTLGRVNLDFSTVDLPAPIYRMGGENDPGISTSEEGRYVISVVGNDDPEASVIQYQVSNDEPEKRIFIDGGYRPGYIQLPRTSFDVNNIAVEDADIVLGDIHALELKTFAPDAKAYGLEVDVYQVVEGNELFLLHVDTIIGRETVHLPAFNLDGTATVYRIRPQVPSTLREVWLPPQIADFSLTGNDEKIVVMTRQGESDQRMITVLGQVTDLNNQQVGGMIIGFFTDDIAKEDYTRGYDGYLPHQSTTETGEYLVRLRARDGQNTTYSAHRQNSINGTKDRWGNIRRGSRLLEAWLGGFTITQSLTLPVDIESNQQDVPIQLPVAFHHVKLTIKDSIGSILSNMPATLYYLDNEGKYHTIGSYESDNDGLVELYLPGVQGRAAQVASYKFTLNPRSSDVVTMTAEPINFNVTDKAEQLNGTVTIEEKRYVTVSGLLTDSNGLPIQDLSMGIRSDDDKGWNDKDTTNILGEYNFRLRAKLNAQTTFALKNHSTPSNLSYWNDDNYYDFWGKVSDETGHFFAWSRGGKLLTPVVISTDKAHFEIGALQLPVALKKST